MDKFDKTVSSYERNLRVMYSQIFRQDVTIKINIGLGPLDGTDLFECKFGCFGELYVNDKKSIYIEMYNPEQSASELKYGALYNIASLIQLNGIDKLRQQGEKE